jgi:hypothetical protein
MYIGIDKAVASRKAQLAAAILVASATTVAADERFPSNQYYGPYENNGSFVKAKPGLAPSRADADRNAFFRSGTRGRQGLGASPIHPEGPGNVSD